MSIFRADFYSRPALTSALESFKSPRYENMLHIHDAPVGDYTGLHTLSDCHAHNQARLDVSNPHEFDCTYVKDGTTYRAWGWVAFVLPQSPTLTRPISVRQKETKYRNPAIAHAMKQHLILDQAWLDAAARD